MQEIKCPNCGEVFQVDESSYNQILSQIKNSEFTKELKTREEQLKRNYDANLKVEQARMETFHNQSIEMKEKQLHQKDSEIQDLKAQISAKETEKNLAVTSAVKEKEATFSEEEKKHLQTLAQKETEIQELKAIIKANETEKNLAVTTAIQEKEAAFSVKENNHTLAIAQKESEILDLKAKLESSQKDIKIAVEDAKRIKDEEIRRKETEVAELKNEIFKKEAEATLNMAHLTTKYDEQLKAKDEQIQLYRDFKAKQSVKMLGENLEQHCLAEFNKIRMTAFPSAYFEKDNDIREGSKGDFIFREFAEDGTELISIMFEMKNEADETAIKHKNEDFFKKLDKDRTTKKCEYAVLVSLLEGDNEFYNAGIADVSYKYPKMYVVRPQCFISIITLLRNAAQNSLHYRQELQVVRNQHLDILHFEENMKAFKDGFARNYRLASEKFTTAIEEIDKTIDHLQKTKAALLSSENNLRLANNKAEELSIKKLTKNAPSVAEMFDDLHR